MPSTPDWSELERAIASLPHRAAAAVAVRAARRAAPAILAAEEDFGEVALEWFNAAAATLRMIEAFVQGESVTGFTLTIAAELPRLAASSMAAAMRGRGPSRHVERTETALAAVSFAADAARATSTDRISKAVMISLQNAEATEPSIGRLAAFDVKTLASMPAEKTSSLDVSESSLLGELWPYGEPSGWSTAWIKLKDAHLPQILTTSPGSIYSF